MVGEGGRRREEEEDAGLVDEADAAAPLVDERGMVVWCVVLGQAFFASLVAEFDDAEEIWARRRAGGLDLHHVSVVCACLCMWYACIYVVYVMRELSGS